MRPRPLNWMSYADTLTQKRRDVRDLQAELTALEAAHGQLKPGPGYHEQSQRLKTKVEDFRRRLKRAQDEFTQLQTGTQATLL